MNETLVAVLSVAAGVLIITVSWYDVFHTLLNPSGRGTMSRLVFASSWRVARRLGRAGGTVGPASVVIVIASWAGLQIVGWALIYLPSLPAGFTYAPGIDPENLLPIFEALYFSAATLTTLGFGDLVPNEQWLRMIVPIEALTGFALLSSAAAWFIQIHGALARQRALALRLTQLRESGFIDLLTGSATSSTAIIVESLAAQLAATRIDIMQTAETYYFRELDSRFSLASGLVSASAIGEAASASPQPEVRNAGVTMQIALHDLARHLDTAFLRREVGLDSVLGDVPNGAASHAARVFHHIARDHRHDIS